MLLLEELVLTLDASEQRSFVQFLRVQRAREVRIDEQLFEAIVADAAGGAKKFLEAHYGVNQRNAYHAVRKRLLTRLYSFFQWLGDDARAGTSAEPALVINAADRLIQFNKGVSAEKLLSKTKEVALRHENFEGALDILRFEIEHAEALGVKYEELISEWRALHEQTRIQQRVEISYTLLKIKLREVRVTGHMSDLDALVRKELEDLGVDLDQALPAAVVYKMLDIIRMAIIAAKQYHQFETLVEQTYSHLSKSGRLSDRDLKHRIGFCYMMAHTKFRVRKFTEAQIWNEQLKWLFSQSKKADVRSYIPKYYLLKSLILSHQGEVDRAIDNLHYVLDLPELNIGERLNIALNLAVLHFHQGELARANRVLMDVELNDRRCEQHMGKEWRFKKNLVELLILVDQDKDETALARLRSMQRYFVTFLKDPMNAWSVHFLKGISLYLSDRNQPNTALIMEHLDQMVMYWPVNREDLYALSFRAWLESKLNRLNYYTFLIERLHHQPSDPGVAAYVQGN